MSIPRFSLLADSSAETNPSHPSFTASLISTTTSSITTLSPAVYSVNEVTVSCDIVEHCLLYEIKNRTTGYDQP